MSSIFTAITLLIGFYFFSSISLATLVDSSSNSIPMVILLIGIYLLCFATLWMGLVATEALKAIATLGSLAVVGCWLSYTGIFGVWFGVLLMSPMMLVTSLFLTNKAKMKSVERW